MITALYASICALLLVKLALNVVSQRRKHRVSIGDGGIYALENAIAIHSNASQYIPISLMLLFLLEYNDANLYFVHVFGVALVAGRLLHAYGMSKKFSARVLGMQITIYNLIALSVTNIVIYTLG